MWRLIRPEIRPSVSGLAGLLLVPALALLSPVASAEIYRWVDEDGNVHFSDRVPPAVSKLERHVLDEQGNLREVLHRQRTVEELNLHRERLAAMQDEAQRRARQKAYDRYLWTTFNSLQAVEELRDERMEIRDNQIIELVDERDRLTLAVREESDRRSNNVVAQQNLIRSLEADLAHIEASIEELQTQRREEFRGLSADMQRYEYLQLRQSMYNEEP